MVFFFCFACVFYFYFVFLFYFCFFENAKSFLRKSIHRAEGAWK